MISSLFLKQAIFLLVFATHCLGRKAIFRTVSRMVRSSHPETGCWRFLDGCDGKSEENTDPLESLGKSDPFLMAEELLLPQGEFCGQVVSCSSISSLESMSRRSWENLLKTIGLALPQDPRETVSTIHPAKDAFPFFSKIMYCLQKAWNVLILQTNQFANILLYGCLWFVFPPHVLGAEREYNVLKV
jgi:hypothetical protein